MDDPISRFAARTASGGKVLAGARCIADATVSLPARISAFGHLPRDFRHLATTLEPAPVRVVGTSGISAWKAVSKQATTGTSGSNRRTSRDSGW
ncbi:hypothetical protein OHS58_09705 [Amycolatopsis sp. NBC_00348]|uniref:hypothetical protein n=1 Tax=Amycolatopsis sp. NBC_00348 TaxID=2975956 RepID=UPI002E266CAD